jgi:hypothetical protein
MIRRRPALLMVFHKAWIAFATAVLLASCTVVPAPTTYSYQQTPCPPGVTANAPPPNQSGQPPSATAPSTCYTAVPNGYTYSYYPYVYPSYSYPYYYGPSYYGPTIGVYGGWGWGGHWHHHHHW